MRQIGETFNINQYVDKEKLLMARLKRVFGGIGYSYGALASSSLASFPSPLEGSGITSGIEIANARMSVFEYCFFSELNV